MATLICPECKRESLIRRTGEYETTYIDHDGRSKGLRVPDVTWLECSNCGEAILDDRAMASIEAARRSAVGLLTPNEIREFRAQLHRTQKAMSVLLGIGEKTYCRWESGSYVQSEASDRYLRLLMADRSNVDLLQEIANGKSRPAPAEPLEELRRTFSAIKDVRAVAGRSQTFVALLVQGRLQAA
jgi:putative zinc finger/helix-turn-helix YgiT family protein